MTGMAGTVDGMPDDSTVTTAEDAGAGDAVGAIDASLICCSRQRVWMFKIWLYL